MIRGERFRLEDIQGRAAQAPRPKRFDQRVRIHQAAPAAVDQQRARFHTPQRCAIDHVPAVVRQHDVQRHHVRSGQQFVQFHVGHPDLPGPFIRRVVRPGDHVHAHASRQLRHLRSDGARPDDAERLPLEVVSVDPGPPAGFHSAREVRRPLREGEHQAEGMLPHDRRRPPGLVGYEDAALPRRRQVETVDADGTGRDHAEIGQGAEDVPRPLHESPGIDHHPGAPDPFDFLIRRLGTVGVEDDFSIGFESFQVGRSLHLRRVVPGYDDAYSVRHR